MQENLLDSKNFAKVKSIAMVAVIIAILAIIMIPLPPIILDIFLVSLCLISVLVVLMATKFSKSINLSIFPTIILVIVLFKLALNVATTRQILSCGHENAVSNIIESLGQLIVGGNVIIGVIIFCILMFVNFFVIYKVLAKFTPNLGTNFYEAMDGSGQFIKGDAIAGIIITIVNIIGGVLIGVFHHNMQMQESVRVFTILTVGDGVSQIILSLIIVTAFAIIVRDSKDNDAMTNNF